jgi:hypothetical protein
MKFLSLLGALFLSNTPALADNLMFLKCQGEFASKAINLNTSDVIQENKGRHSKTYVIDKERRMVMSRGGQWFNAEIIDGVLSGSWKLGQGKTTRKETVLMHINPVGDYSTEKNIRQGNITMDVAADGTCEKIDADTFGAEANQ